MLRTETAAFRVVQELGALAFGFERKDPAGPPWKVGDTVSWKVEKTDIVGFALADGGKIDMPTGFPVRLLLLVPLSAAEYTQARQGTSRLRERLKADPGYEAKVHARWLRLMPPEA
jgi:hypothetical protein